MAEGEGVEPSTHEVGPVFETGCAPPRTTFRFYEHSTNWSGWLDSNQRPPASEAGTLAGLSYTLSLGKLALRREIESLSPDR